MFAKGDPKSPATMDEISAFLGKETAFEGKMTFQGVFRLDGKFEGEIFESGTLIVGETAVIKGKVGVHTLVILGHVEVGAVAEVLDGLVDQAGHVEVQPVQLGGLEDREFAKGVLARPADDGGVGEGMGGLRQDVRRETLLRLLLDAFVEGEVEGALRVNERPFDERGSLTRSGVRNHLEAVARGVYDGLLLFGRCHVRKWLT